MKKRRGGVPSVVFASREMMTPARREYLGAGFCRGHTGRVIEVVFVQTVGATEPAWIPISIHREAGHDQTQITGEIRARHIRLQIERAKAHN